MAEAAATITHSGSGASGSAYPPATSARKITPIVFWASWSPCPSASAEAETVCISRNPRSTLCGERRRKIHMIASIRRNAAVKPTRGEATIGMTTLSTIVLQCTSAPAVSAAPTRPPINACDDEEGRPKYQVIKFHTIAPTSPASTITKP